MFKSWGGIERHKKMLGVNLDGSATIDLASSQLQIIEDTELLRLGEKIELVLVSMGYKLTTEIFDTITYHFNELENREEPNKEPLDNLDTLFSQMPFPYFIDSLQKPDRKTGVMKQYTWFQVCVNERVKFFMKNFANTLTEMEDGILYGYPISAIRAFARLTDVTEKCPTSVERYYVGAGRPSVVFYEEEEAHYRQIWNKLRQISPCLIQHAEEGYRHRSNR